MKIIFISLLAAVAQAALADSPGATKGQLRAGREEVSAATYLLGDDKKNKIMQDIRQWPPVLEEVLTVKEWLGSELRSKLTPEELAAVRYRAEHADLKAGLDAYVNRAIRDLLKKPETLELRAREIWLADQSRFFSPEAADVSILFIDAGKRGIDDASKRYREIARQLKKGAKLESLIARYADIVPGQKQPLPPQMRVELRNIEGAAKRAIFFEMKVGEIRGPIPAPEGWLVVQLLKKHERKKLNFEDVKEAIIEELLEETGKFARTAILAKFAETPVVFDQAMFPTVEEEQRKRTAMLATEKLLKELRDKKISSEKINERLLELMQLPDK